MLTNESVGWSHCLFSFMSFLFFSSSFLSWPLSVKPSEGTVHCSGAGPTGSMWTSTPKCCLCMLSVHQQLVPERWYVLCRDGGLTLSFSLPHGAVTCKPQGAACLLQSFSNYSMSSHISVFAQNLRSLIKMVLVWGFSVSNYRQVWMPC